MVENGTVNRALTSTVSIYRLPLTTSTPPNSPPDPSKESVSRQSRRKRIAFVILLPDYSTQGF